MAVPFIIPEKYTDAAVERGARDPGSRAGKGFSPVNELNPILLNFDGRHLPIRSASFDNKRFYW